MPKRNKHQVIWGRNGSEHSDLILKIPNIINSDIGFQLMFGVLPDFGLDKWRMDQDHLKYHKNCVIYNKEHLKLKYR